MGRIGEEVIFLLIIALLLVVAVVRVVRWGNEQAREQESARSGSNDGCVRTPGFCRPGCPGGICPRWTHRARWNSARSVGRRSPYRPASAQVRREALLDESCLRAMLRNRLRKSASYWRCRQCDTRIQPGRETVMFCPKCGNQIADGAKFCPKCGQRYRCGTGSSNAGSTGASGQRPPQVLWRQRRHTRRSTSRASFPPSRRFWRWSSLACPGSSSIRVWCRPATSSVGSPGSLTGTASSAHSFAESYSAWQFGEAGRMLEYYGAFVGRGHAVLPPHDRVGREYDPACGRHYPAACKRQALAAHDRLRGHDAHGRRVGLHRYRNRLLQRGHQYPPHRADVPRRLRRCLDCSTQARVAHDTLGERSSLREEGAHRAQSASNNRSAPARALRTAPSSATVVAAAEASVWPTAPAPTGALAAAKAPLFTPTHRCRAHRAFHGGLCYRMGNGRLPLRR